MNYRGLNSDEVWELHNMMQYVKYQVDVDGYYTAEAYGYGVTCGGETPEGAKELLAIYCKQAILAKRDESKLGLMLAATQGEK